MAVTIQLKSFTVKSAPVPADIMYLGDSANSFDEVQSTVAEVIGAYPALVSIGSLTTTANEIIYTTGSNTYATAPITAFGLSVLALTSGVTTPTAGSFATWDANADLSAKNFLAGFQAIPSAGATTTLTVASPQTTQITGSANQTVVLPVVSTLAIGTPYKIINSSTGTVTVQSSGANTVQVLAAGTAVELNSILTSGTSAASWYSIYLNPADLSGAVLLSPSAAQTILTYPLNVPRGLYTPAILDANGAILMSCQTVASAVNYMNAVNNATGQDPGFTALGSDTNINIALLPKGSGVVKLLGPATATNISFGGSALSVYSQNIAWTPVFTFSTPGDLSVSYSSQLGWYTRTGNVVVAGFQITLTPTYTTASGSILINGLPFSPNASNGNITIGISVYSSNTYPTGVTYPVAFLTPGSSAINVYGGGSAITLTPFSILNAATANPITLVGTITYLV